MQKYATIRTHLGGFRYKRLPFGLKTAPLIFQKFISNLLRKAKGVLVYMDDLIVTGKDEHEFLENLRNVLEILLNEGLKLKPEKCAWLEKSVS